jgi:hypothetical protein
MMGVSWPAVQSAETANAKLLNNRVKISAPKYFDGERKFRVSAIAVDTLVLERYHKGNIQYDRIPWSDVTGCRLHDGMKRNTFRGAFIGAACGCGLAVVMLLLDKNPPTDFGNLVLRIPVIGGLSGALAGGAMGFSTFSDRWVDVPKESVQFGIVPNATPSPGLTIAIKF